MVVKCMTLAEFANQYKLGSGRLYNDLTEELKWSFRGQLFLDYINYICENDGTFTDSDKEVIFTRKSFRDYYENKLLECNQRKEKRNRIQQEIQNCREKKGPYSINESNIVQAMLAKDEEDFGHKFDQLTTLEKMELDRLLSLHNIPVKLNVSGWMWNRIQNYNTTSRQKYYNDIKKPEYIYAHKEYIKSAGDRVKELLLEKQAAELKRKRKEDLPIVILLGILLLVVGGLFFYFIGIPILKYIWILITFIPCGMTYHIDGSSPSFIEFFIGLIGAIFVIVWLLNMINRIFK